METIDYRAWKRGGRRSGRPVAVGIHIYSGAFTLGVAEHFDIAGQWEEGRWGAPTFELNFKGVPHPLRRADWPVNETRGRVSLVYANPPCVAWSMGGVRKPESDDRSRFVDGVVDTALRLEPDFFIWESVARVLTAGREKVDGVTERFNKAGYAVTVLLTDALLHGVPQTRRRFHLIAHRYKLDLKAPTVDYDDIVTVRAAIEDLEQTAVPVGRKSNRLNHVYFPFDDRDANVAQRVEKGEEWECGYTRAVDRGLPARRSSFMRRRLWYDAPARTVVTATTYLLHPTLDRDITPREAARLCCYPDDFVFARGTGTRADTIIRGSDISQAVLPPVGEMLAKTMRRALKNGQEERPSNGFTLVNWLPLARKYAPLQFVRARGVVE